MLLVLLVQGGSSFVAWVAVALLVAAAAAAFKWLPSWAPFIGDWKREKSRRSNRRQRLLGYKHAVGLQLVKALDAEQEEWALRSPNKRLPAARFIETTGLVSLLVKQTAGASDDSIQSRAEAYAPVVGAPSNWVRVERPSDSVVRVLWPSTAPVDPLDTPQGIQGTGSLADGIPCGIQEDGSPLLAVFENQSGAVVGGVPGSGKSAGATSIIAQLCANPAFQTVIIDGKGGSDWEWAAPRASLLNRDDDDLEAVKRQLLAITGFMRHRLQSQKEERGASNFWHAGATEEHPFLLVVIDECQTFFDQKEHLTKEAKQLSQEIAALVVNLVKKGRSAGVFCMSITQKPTSDSIPSALSANCGVKWACRVETSAASESILGSRPDDAPDNASPTLIPETRPGGVTIKRGGQWVRARFAYTPEAEAAAIAQQYASLRIPFEELVNVERLQRTE